MFCVHFCLVMLGTHCTIMSQILCPISPFWLWSAKPRFFNGYSRIVFARLSCGVAMLRSKTSNRGCKYWIFYIVCMYVYIYIYKILNMFNIYGPISCSVGGTLVDSWVCSVWIVQVGKTMANWEPRWQSILHRLHIFHHSAFVFLRIFRKKKFKSWHCYHSIAAVRHACLY